MEPGCADKTVRMKMQGHTSGKAGSKEGRYGGWVCRSQLNRGKDKARQWLGRTRQNKVMC